METETLPATKSTKPASCIGADHQERLLGMRDAIEVLSGKWKIQLIGALLFGGKMRFMDLLREVDGIAAKCYRRSYTILKRINSLPEP